MERILAAALERTLEAGSSSSSIAETEVRLVLAPPPVLRPTADRPLPLLLPLRPPSLAAAAARHRLPVPNYHDLTSVLAFLIARITTATTTLRRRRRRKTTMTAVAAAAAVIVAMLTRRNRRARRGKEIIRLRSPELRKIDPRATSSFSTKRWRERSTDQNLAVAAEAAAAVEALERGVKMVPVGETT